MKKCFSFIPTLIYISVKHYKDVSLVHFKRHYTRAAAAEALLSHHCRSAHDVICRHIYTCTLMPLRSRKNMSFLLYIVYVQNHLSKSSCFSCQSWFNFSSCVYYISLICWFCQCLGGKKGNLQTLRNGRVLNIKGRIFLQNTSRCPVTCHFIMMVRWCW